MRLAVLSLLVLSSCFTEPSADRVWRCTADKPQCPDGQTCVNDWCVKEGTAQPDLSMQTDGGASDMTQLKPCQDGFPLGTQGVWACRGAFSPASPASSLCKNGYKVCTDGLKVTDAECSSTSIKGFFFANLPAQGTTGSAARCLSTPPANGAGGMWYGCGWYQGKAPLSTERTNNPCQNLPLITYCNSTDLFTCNQSDLRLDAQKMDNAQNGVLCCPP